ncbi:MULTISPECIES: UDP-N-acetylmuramoyl-L-alanyl-D-glutamate--2,6-diaminopimelate ligase [unclassified Adlercreutzia]|uniref:UDP-N-acetylmuramoyl-L-alanyl-D-glutamate--2, 6-diaminopimelate ligase n=1 Tax=unclassified Adlercreutzia TaxID=2636013 RepID=UPI0013EC4345|nr:MULTISPECIES: UDP-N-acetylmuramoyl-L-alanyl-D-glutamate--2,6-diaminopimelate ligase [unclassified Adlercreutzia]
MGKTCAELFEGLECTIIGNADEEVTGLAYRSDRVSEGDVFFCIVGLTTDGHSFAQDAIDRGARVLVVERKVYLADATDVTEVVVSDSRKAMAYAATRFFDEPSASFQLVGITGTNGKTTTTYLVEHIARVAGKRTGVIGTVGTRIGDVQERSEHTTPESPDLQETFARMRAAHCDVVAMEVSSHALDLVRTWRTQFAVTAFTNLTQDHLDYHHTFDAYFEAKALLFSRDYPARRVISVNDKWGLELLRRCSAAGDAVITFGFDSSAQIFPVAVDYAAAHTHVVLDVRGRRFDFTYPLVGRFNVENVMCAFGIGMQLGIAPEVIVEALADVPSVPGRLERVKVPADGGVSVYVDYAHTPDALAKALSSVKALSPQRTLVVFGCGGNRDASKRPIMGRAALAADFAVVTSDNPRHEDPLGIIDDILAGMTEGAGRFEVEPDRRRAIARAIALAEPGDSILVAGKGHEDYQLVGDEVLSFDDRVVAAEELTRAFGGAADDGGAAGAAGDDNAAADAAGGSQPHDATEVK